MPLIKKKPVPLIPLPPNVDDLPPDTQVFFLKATGEIFLEYDAYANRLSYLLCRIFQTAHNGQGMYDYFAALDDEKKEADKVRAKFPDALQGRVLASVQFQVFGRLDGLVDEIYDRYKDRYFKDEKVFVDCGGVRYYARVAKVFPPASIRLLAANARHSRSGAEGKASTSALSPLSSVSPSPPPSDDYSEFVHKIGCDLSILFLKSKTEDDPEDYLYTVQLVDDDDKFEGSYMEVKAKVLSRDRLGFSKTILKRYLKDCVTRDALIGSPWIVKPLYATMYGITTTQSNEGADRNRIIREGKLAKRRKLPRDEDGAMIPPLNKKKKTGVKPEDGSSASGRTSTPVFEKRIPPEPPKKAIKYPIEDLDLDPMSIHDGRILRRVNSELPPLPPKPVASKTLLVPKEIFDVFLITWNMLNVFSKPLFLSTFSLDDFAAALRHQTLEPRCALLAEIHACLTNIISSDQSRVLGSTGAPPRTSIKGKEKEVSEDVEMNGGEVAEEEEEDEEDEFDSLLRKGVSYAKRWDRTAKLKCSEGREGWERHMIGALVQRGGPIHMPNLPRILRHLFSPTEGTSNSTPASPSVVKTAPTSNSKLSRPSKAAARSASGETQSVPETETDPGEDEEEIDELEIDELEVRADSSQVADDDLGALDEITADPEVQYLTLSLEDKLDILSYLVTLALGSKVVRNYIEDSESQLTEYRKQRAEVNKERKALLEQKAVLDGKPVKVEGDDAVVAPFVVPAIELNGHGTSNGHTPAAPASTPSRLAIVSVPPRPVYNDDDEETVQDTEEDQLASESEAESEDAMSVAASEGGAPVIGAALSARRAALEEKRLERLAQEASRSIELTKAREEAKVKNAGRREADKARLDLDEAVAKNMKRDDLVEREFRRYQGVARLRPLGKDRFFNRYWWLDGIGGMNLIGQGNGILYGTGRLFVQGPTEEDWQMACVRGAEDMVQRRAREDVDPAATLQVNEWAFYEEEEEIDNLQSWLNSKGVRELALKNALAKWRPYILAGSRRRQADSAKPFHPPDARRSTRSKADAEHMTAHYLAWSNKLAKA